MKEIFSFNESNSTYAMAFAFIADASMLVSLIFVVLALPTFLLPENTFTNKKATAANNNKFNAKEKFFIYEII